MRHDRWNILATASFLVFIPFLSAHAQYGGGGGGGGFGSGMGGGRGGIGLGMGLSSGRGNYGGMGYGNNIYNTYGARSPNMPFSRGAVNAIGSWPYPSSNGFAGSGGMGGGYGGGLGGGLGYVNGGQSYRTGPNVPNGAIYSPTSTYYSAYGQGPSTGYYANYMNRSYVAPRRTVYAPAYRRVVPRTYYRAAPVRYYYAR